MWVADPFPPEHVAVSEAADSGQHALCARLNLSEDTEAQSQGLRFPFTGVQTGMEPAVCALSFSSGGRGDNARRRNSSGGSGKFHFTRRNASMLFLKRKGVY